MRNKNANLNIDFVKRFKTSLFGIFSPLSLYYQWIQQKKSGEPVDFNQFSARVTSKGFEPPTLRAEI